MSKTEKDGWQLVIAGAGLCCLTLLWIGRFGVHGWTDGFVLFIGGWCGATSLSSYLLMRQRMFWNRLYGRDLWDNSPPQR